MFKQVISSGWSGTKVAKMGRLISILAVFVFASSLYPGAITIPQDGTNAFFQTNGPNSELKWGDWWTSSDASAGNQPHMFEIYVPSSVPGSYTLEIELYDPESYQTGSEIDEQEGVGLPSKEWDSTHFWLLAPDSSTEIVNITYPPSASTSEQWNAFASVSISQYGTGIYRLFSISDVDDQNSFKIKIVEADPDGVPNSGDEINVAPVKSSYQHFSTGCTSFWFFVPDKPELRLSNFDMDGETSVVYTDPDGNVINGTVSGGTVWNNGGGAGYPPPGGDVITNPTVGWWRADLCIGVGNQYIFWSEGAVFIENPPSFPDCDITKDDGITETTPNFTQTYKILVVNSGTGPALNTVVADTLPDNVTYVEATGSPTVGSYNGRTTLQWDLGQLAGGARDSVYVTVTVNSNASGTVLNKAYLSYDDVLYNNYSGIFDSDEDTIVSPATIGDLVWYDADSSGTKEPGENGIDNVTLYLINSSGDTIDTQTTDQNGAYSFANVAPGSYTVDVDNSTVSIDYVLTTSSEPLSVTVTSGQNYQNADFGYVEGPDSDGDRIKDHLEGTGDRDGDGIPDNEDYDPSGYIYAETTGEILSGGSIQVSGPGAITILYDGSTGYYEFYTDGTAGTYTVTVTPPPGYQLSTTCTSSDPPPIDPTGQSNPLVLGNGENGSTGFLTSADCTPYYFTFNLESGDPFIINNNYPMRYTGIDFGDAQDPTYPSLLASNGARHSIVPGFYLGSSVDAESDGQPSATGFGDDSDGNDDDDGITFPGALVQSSENTIQVVASADGYLNGWMDLNQDGDWADAGEHIIQDVALTAGTNNVTFTLPEISYEPPLRTVGLMSRFRFSSQTGLSYTGYAPDGEVEDYLVDTMIPVELTGFSAIAQNGMVVLSWQTQTESGNLGFYVYRSESPNGTYAKITEKMIPGQGNSESQHEYSFVDQSAEPGKTYFYKIADVSLDGTLTLHGPKEVRVELPADYALKQNYPNPFNPETIIEYSLKEAGTVNLTVYNINGQVVKTLVSEYREAGHHKTKWDGRNSAGDKVPSGIYLYSLQINDVKMTRRMALTK